MIREKRVSNLDQSEVNLVYQYDASGAIIGFTYYPSSGTASQYFFGKNAQGDVLCIYDASGVLMAGYAYDAWGACTVAYDHSIIDVADINPIRYRSYYYDAETGWYYLQSRYYDPTVGRFISPDDPSLLGANGDLLSYNLYVYCSNSPINYADHTGYAIDTVFDVFSLLFSLIEVCATPYDIAAWASLAGDIVDVSIPFLTGVGETVRALKAGETIIDGADNAIDTYRALKKANKGKGLEVHHILEKRFAQMFKLSKNDMLSIALSKSEHRVFTNLWRGIVEYGSSADKSDIVKAIFSVYDNNSKLAGIALYTIYSKII